VRIFRKIKHLGAGNFIRASPGGWDPIIPRKNPGRAVKPKSNKRKKRRIARPKETFAPFFRHNFKAQDCLTGGKSDQGPKKRIVPDHEQM